MLDGQGDPRRRESSGCADRLLAIQLFIPTFRSSTIKKLRYGMPQLNVSILTSWYIRPYNPIVSSCSFNKLEKNLHGFSSTKSTCRPRPHLPRISANISPACSATMVAPMISSVPLRHKIFTLGSAPSGWKSESAGGVEMEMPGTLWNDLENTQRMTWRYLEVFMGALTCWRSPPSS